MGGQFGRRKTLLSAVAAIGVICLAATVFVVFRGEPARNIKDDCCVVKDLVAHWSQELGAAQQKLAAGTNGREDTLAVADKEAELADEIRASVGDVVSADIARDLDRWATGADQMAQSRREEINNPDPDVTAPPPRSYTEGSIAAQQATAGLVKACPSALPPMTNT